MAKKIEFPLNITNVKKIHTARDFRKHFDIKEIFKYKSNIYKNMIDEKVFIRPVARNEIVFIKYTNPIYRKKILKYYYKNILVKGKYTIFLLEDIIYFSNSSGSGSSSFIRSSGSGSYSSNVTVQFLYCYGIDII